MKEMKDKPEADNFLVGLRENLLVMKDLLNKRIEQQYDLLNNKDGRLETLFKLGSVNVLTNELRMSELDEKQIKLKTEEISKLSEELKTKIK